MAVTLVLSLLYSACASQVLAYDMGKAGRYNVISCGEGHTGAIDINGSLWMWGHNNSGELGDGTTNNSNIPIKVMDNVTTVSCGYGNTAAVRTDGSLWMWGWNYYGQLGNDTTEDSNIPVKVMDNVTTVSCGWYHTAALKSDGSLWTWGSNLNGSVGNGGVGNNKTVEDDPIQTIPVKVMDNVTTVNCGQSYTAAIQTDGSLWVWGNDSDGQLGNGASGRFSNSTVPVKIMDDAVAVSCGTSHTAAIQTDGSLWMWGCNREGQLGNGTTENSNIPVKMMDNIAVVCCGPNQTAAIKADNSLWMWGNNYHGQLGNGTTEMSAVPVKVTDSVVSASCGNEFTATLKIDGSLWMWGSSSAGKLGNRGIGNAERSGFPIQTVPVKVMDNVSLADASITSPSNEYIYDTSDSGESVVLDTSYFDNVRDSISASSAVQAQVQTMTNEQKNSATGIDLATLYAETAISKAANKKVSGKEVIINKAAVADLEAVAAQTSAAVETALINGGIATARLVSNTVTLTTDETGEITLKIDPDILETQVDKIRVETPTYAITLKVDDLEEDLASGVITITSEDVGSGFAPGNQNKKTTVKVNLPKGKTANPVTLSLPTDSGDTTYQAVVKTDGSATSSKYNPATTTMDGKVNTSGSYTVQTNQKDFTDIANKSAEMQKAIRYLASKGIINGTSATEFSPDGSINRAEIAALLVRALGKLDNGATNSFTDVKRSDWYYSAAGSSQKCGLINGYTDNTFRGTTTIAKDQILAVAARVLKNEMGYKEPSNPNSYLVKYSDTVTKWAQPEVALATKENLVVYRVDGTFKGESNMTRGDAAIIIYRLFQKIW